MVAFNQLFDDETLEFYAGRNFKYDDVDYVVGNRVPNELVRNARNRESLVRARYAVPVAEDITELPRAYAREVKDKALFFIKYQCEPTEAATVEELETENPSEAGVREFLTDHQTIAEWAYALVYEANAEDPDETLIEWIKAGSDDVDPQDLADFVDTAANYAEGEALEDFTFDADVIPAADAPNIAAKAFTDGDHNIQQTQDWLNENKTVPNWAYVLLAEQRDKNRTTLVTWIKAGATGVTAGALQTYVETAANFNVGQPLADFVAQDGLDAY